ncbi:hypothetical protein HHK36_025815 [Tetracentron sinense]|uniref:CTLH domain-containing protein n=1 Tax=Tetracentron sinense TaxID=13715 RepID=A0A834YHL0_TETSI|nr:hypothetical protein HHK36_025815 [Tetracentron sinense]
MSSLSRELVFLILQFLDEEKFKGTVQKLEQESGFFFNMRYFEDAVTNGEWDDVEKYLSGFTKVDDNRYSMKIFFEIRKQKYLEALDKKERAKAVEVLVKDLKVFSAFNDELFKEITQLLTLDNFRENEQLSKYGDTKSARGIMLVELKKLIEANPLFRDKLLFPSLKSSRLRTMINQRLLPFQSAPTPHPTSLAWMTNPSPVPHPTVSAGPIGLAASNNAAILKRPRTPPTMDYQTADSENVLKRSRPFGISDEVNNLHVNILPVAYTGQSHAQNLYSSDDLPKTLVMTLSQGSAVKSMDFHPSQQTLLLVGTNIGDIMVWDIASRERLALRNFKVRDLGACSMTLQATLANESTSSVNRVMWSPDGILFGVAYSKNIVHLYTYHGGDDLRNRLEIDAHVGSVNDIAFSHPNKQLSVITCGEDKTIKVWDAATGSKQYTFEGHEAPVYSVCPHHKENIQFIFSTATDGKIKAWLYDNLGSRVDYDAPGHSCTTMAYSADGTRLFSCGTSKEGDSYIVEWNESEGAVKRTYHGLGKRAAGVVQFDTTKNRFLAAGDDFGIKFWDMDNVSLLTSTDAGGGLPATPCIRFNKEGTLLSVSTSENGIKILANADGFQMLHTLENRSFDASRIASGTVVKAPTISTFGASSATAGTSTGVADRGAPVAAMVGLVSRLIYTNSGVAILALASNAVHKLWKWPRNDRNVSGKATASVQPQLWQPSSGILMTNDISDKSPEYSVPCFALSKNDSYVMSASGGKISLFNMMTFKTMTTFMPPPPAATFLAFHPQDNNVIAIGMEDSSIQIYNVRVDEVKSKLKGHQKRITGLAFSHVLNVLVSSGADAQLCVWSIDRWEKQAYKFLQIPTGRTSDSLAETRVQFHQDQIHLLAVHETQIAIYEAPKLECIKQWVPRESSGPITHATYSCDSQSIYVSFNDASVSVLTSTTLRLRCRINPTSYLPSNLSSRAYPVVIAAHPSESNQFALGLNDGGVYVLEPLESEGKWGNLPPTENDAGPSIASGAAGSDQAPR